MDKDLGFGLMRLPHRGPSIDIERTSEMIDRFMEAGYTYFDTAFVYVGSEKAARKALIERHPRESYTLATKLYAAVVPTEALAKKELDTSLKRMLMYGKEASNRKQEIDRQHYTIPNQRPKDKHCGKI